MGKEWIIIVKKAVAGHSENDSHKPIQYNLMNGKTYLTNTLELFEDTMRNVDKRKSVDAAY